MDWIDIQKYEPKIGTTIWALSALGNVYLGIVNKSKSGFILKTNSGDTLRNFQKWATWDVIY